MRSFGSANSGQRVAAAEVTKRRATSSHSDRPWGVTIGHFPALLPTPIARPQVFPQANASRSQAPASELFFWHCATLISSLTQITQPP